MEWLGFHILSEIIKSGSLLRGEHEVLWWEWLPITMETKPATCPRWWPLQKVPKAFFASSPYSHPPTPHWINLLLTSSILCSLGRLFQRKQSCFRPLLLFSDKLAYVGIHFLICEIRKTHFFGLLWGIYFIQKYIVCVCKPRTKHFWINSDTFPTSHPIKSRTNWRKGIFLPCSELLLALHALWD